MLPLGKLLAAVAVAASTLVVHNGDVSLPAKVITPVGFPGPRPAVVLIQGAGPRGVDAYLPEAEAFARAGIVMLIYQKRIVGYTPFNRSFADLAGDALAGVRLLRARPDVDPARVGVWGYSEGGWVAPLAATLSSSVAFVVTVAGSGLPPARTQVWSNRTYLSRAGVQDRFLGPLGEDFTDVAVSGGLFGEASYDAAATLRKVRQPLLGIFGADDGSTAPGESMSAFAASLTDTHTLRVIPGVGHSVRTADGAFPPGYLDLITSWINAQPSTSTADPLPSQQFQSAPVSIPWYRTAFVQALALVLLLLGFGLSLLAPTRACVARWVFAGGSLLCLGVVAYLGSLMSTGGLTPGPVFLGRPVIWLVLQLLAVAVLAAAVVLWRRRRPSRRQAIPLLTTVLFAPWVISWGLLTP